jgi:hypothetical protein
MFNRLIFAGLLAGRFFATGFEPGGKEYFSNSISRLSAWLENALANYPK